MKKLTLILMVLVLSAVSFSAFAADTLTGNAKGFGGELTVEVQKDGDKITSVEVTKHGETAGISDPAFATVPAAIVAANSTEVDVAAGATVTSKAIIAAVNNAIDPTNFPYEAPVVATNDSNVALNLWDRKVYHSAADYDTTKDLTEEQINALAASAFTIPTGGGQRSLAFFFITNEDKIAQIEASHGYADSMLGAPLTIVIAGDSRLTKNPHMEIEDAGIASMALSTQATEMGLGSIILSINDDVVPAAIKEALELGDEYVPHLLVSVGYASADAKASASAQEGIDDTRLFMVK